MEQVVANSTQQVLLIRLKLKVMHLPCSTVYYTMYANKTAFVDSHSMRNARHVTFDEKAKEKSKMPIPFGKVALIELALRV